MSVSIAEYFGQRTDVDDCIIEPVSGNQKCPFMGRSCKKMAKRNPNKPVCSVRKNDGTIWIVCPDRLCSTTKTINVLNGKKENLPLDDHQKDILWQIAQTIYREDIKKNDIAVSREISIKLDNDAGSYFADYIMRNSSENKTIDKIVLEMQGGGETSNTGAITRHIKKWENDPNRSNEMLRKSVAAGTIETNAWRRQQEQFLVKGNVTIQTGGKLIFAVGTLLYDYLIRKIEYANLNDLRSYDWSMCIIAFKEDMSEKKKSGPIRFKVDKDRLLFTNYASFVRALTDQGSPRPEIFNGDFETLVGEMVKLSD